MGNNLPFFDIILLAAVAVFLVLRLRSTLGKRTGFDEKPDHDPFQDRGDNDNVVNLPNREDRHRDDSQFLDSSETPTKEIRTGSLHGGKVAVDVLPFDSALAEGLSAIQMSDRSFDPAEFVQGAGSAFEMIIGSFADGDTKTLRNLLDDEVYHDFKSAIDERESLKQTHETVMIGINDVDIIEAEMSRRHAVVTVKFVSEQVNVTRDKDGNTVSGDPNHVSKVTDIWTFTRDTRSKDPNWLLVETRSPN